MVKAVLCDELADVVLSDELADVILCDELADLLNQYKSLYLC
jgi:hypothetical protein